MIPYVLFCTSETFDRVGGFISSELSYSVVSNSLQPHGLQHTRLPCLSPTPGACSDSSIMLEMSSNLLILCHPLLLRLQSFPASGSFPMSQFFTSGGQRIGVSASASVLPMNIQDWFPLGLTGWISLQSKGLSRVFSNTIVQKHQFFSSALFISVIIWQKGNGPMNTSKQHQQSSCKNKISQNKNKIAIIFQVFLCGTYWCFSVICIVSRIILGQS